MEAGEENFSKHIYSERALRVPEEINQALDRLANAIEKLTKGMGDVSGIELATILERLTHWLATNSDEQPIDEGNSEIWTASYLGDPRTGGSVECTLRSHSIFFHLDAHNRPYQAVWEDQAAGEAGAAVFIELGQTPAGTQLSLKSVSGGKQIALPDYPENERWGNGNDFLQALTGLRFDPPPATPVPAAESKPAATHPEPPPPPPSMQRSEPPLPPVKNAPTISPALTGRPIQSPPPSEPPVTRTPPAPPPVPSAVRQAVPQPSTRKGGGKCWIIAFSLLGLALCAGMVLVLGLWATGSLTFIKNQIANNIPAIATATPVRVYPSMTPEKEVSSSATPVQSSSTGTYEVDFTTSGKGWEEVINSVEGIGYNVNKKCYTFLVMDSNSVVYSIAPLPFKQPYHDMSVTFTGRAVNGESMSYGLLYRVKTGGNFYYVGISKNMLTMKKVIDGQWSTLTYPEWIEIQEYNPLQNGNLTVQVTYIGDVTTVNIGGIDQVRVVDDDLKEGDVALFVDSNGVPGGGSDIGGVYGHAEFDYFAASLR
jgi:hypothetical protein